ncbi:MAG: DUF5110 domain-containing protein [Anaerolineaceae bacterium]|nr:DUF5110 domain-containing protein [Anaerolineaceae bacterium]
MIDRDYLIIETSALKIKYMIGRSFSSKTLSIEFKNNGYIWHFNDSNYSNLGGTYRTLDETDGPVELDNGLNSLSGWSVINDSETLVFDESGWLIPRDKSSNYQDFYFFGYGKDYLSCIQDYQKVSGQVPLIPRWALGNWWSRYWPYSQGELLSLMDKFQYHNVPLSVCIIDMDWHITKTGNSSTGWTGYSWNKELFPDPEGFLGALKDRNLSCALNLHPAEGVHPHEVAYEKMAQQLGVDPKLMNPLPFDITDKNFVKAYFDHLHHPLEDMGVNFWWIDWQQGNQTKLKNLDPLFCLNHLHSFDLCRDGTKRPFIFSRWPGLGGHRYPIGFSGDTIVSWESLDFQPYFTSTAANVAFSWWSHDIGGHMGGIEDPELYLRWVQFGVFSPIMRLHSTNNPYHERCPWGFDAEIEKDAIEALQLRHRLIPYIYSAARVNTKDGIPLILPMYFNHPEDMNAYQCSKQYYFGSELIVAPFTTPTNEDTRFSRQVIWLPEGEWYNFFTGSHCTGGGWYGLYGQKSDIPVFAKAGSIIPLSNDPVKNGADNPRAMEIKIFAGANHTYTLYEDDGVSMDYENSDYSEINFEQKFDAKSITFSINSTHSFPNSELGKRSYELVFIGISEPTQTFLHINGNKNPFLSEYDPYKGIFKITFNSYSIDQDLVVNLINETGILSMIDNTLANLDKFIRYTKCNTYTKYAFINRMPEFKVDKKVFLEFADKFQPEQHLAISEIIQGKHDKRISYKTAEAIQDLYRRFFV